MGRRPCSRGIEMVVIHKICQQSKIVVSKLLPALIGIGIGDLVSSFGGSPKSFGLE